MTEIQTTITERRTGRTQQGTYISHYRQACEYCGYHIQTEIEIAGERRYYSDEDYTITETETGNHLDYLTLEGI